MIDLSKTGTYKLGSHTVRRLGYGAMQLAGPHVFGPPRDRDAALAGLREAGSSGVKHIDTCAYYGPPATNKTPRKAPPPPPDLPPLAPKTAPRRGSDASWLPASSPEELT